MTATQVFNRFIKDYECYWIKPIIKDLFNDAINQCTNANRLECNYDLLKIYYKKKHYPPIDFLLKYYRISFQSLLSEIWWKEENSINHREKYGYTIEDFKKIRRDFQNFLKENVEGGYKKYFIRDSEAEYSWGYRNGYYYIDFKWKDGKNKCNKHKK